MAPFIKSFLINAKRASFYQDRLGTNIGKTLIEKTCLCRATTLTAGQMRALSKAVRAEGYGNVFSAPFYGLLKTNVRRSFYQDGLGTNAGKVEKTHVHAGSRGTKRARHASQSCEQSPQCINATPNVSVYQLTRTVYHRGPVS